jgi:hypothetical protein
MPSFTVNNGADNDVNQTKAVLITANTRRVSPKSGLTPQVVKKD